MRGFRSLRAAGLFPGTVPHAVMCTVLPPGAPEPETPRISIGVNWAEAVTPAPAPPAKDCS